MTISKRLRVIIRSSETATEIKNCDCPSDVTGILKEAAAEDCSNLFIGAVPTEGTDSEYFATLTEKWNRIVSHLKENEFPELITIVCPTQEIRDYYMMVYNYWHASGKEDRLMSEEWD